MTKWMVLPAVLALVGCTTTQPTVWQKAGTSPADLTSALNACTATATQSYPVDMEQVQVAPGYNQAAGSGCGFTPSSGTQTCASGGSYVQPQTRQEDGNLKPRNAAVATCMTGQGWSAGGS